MGAAAVPLTLATGVGGAALGGVSAIAGNSAVRESMESSRDATAQHLMQLRRQAQQQRAERGREAARVEGRIRVAAAEAGAGFGGSFLALTRQNDLDAARDRTTINANLGANIARVESGFAAHQRQLASQGQNPLLAMLGGALQGVSTGLSIVNAAGAFADLRQERARFDAAQEIVP